MDLEKTVSIIFRGTDLVSDSVTSAKSSIEGFTPSIAGITSAFSDLGMKILATDAAMTTLAVGGIALAIHSATEFSGQFNQIVQVAGLSGDAVGKFRDDVMTYAHGSTQSISEINASLLIATKSHIDYKDSLELIKAAEDLAMASHSSLSASTSALATAITAYGGSTKDAEDYAAILFKGAQDGRLTVDELSGSLGKVVGTAAEGKVPFTDLVAAISALTAQGVLVSDAVGAVNRAIFAIIKPSKDASEAANALNIGFDASSLAANGLQHILSTVAEATANNADLFTSFFGSVKGFNAAAMLANDTSGIFANTLSDMANRTPAFNDAIKVVAESFGNMSQNLKNNVAVVLDTFGIQLVPGITGDMGALSDLFKSIKLSMDSGAFQPIVDLLKSGEGQIHDILETIATNFPDAMSKVDFSGLIAALQTLAGSLGGMFTGIDLSTPQGLADAIQTLVNLVTKLVNVTDTIAEAFKPAVQWIIDLGKGIGDTGPEFDQMIGNLAALGLAIEKLGVGLIAAVLLFQGEPGKMTDALNIAAGAMGVIWNGLLLTIQLANGAILGAMDLLMSGLNTISFGAYQDNVDRLDKSLADNADAIQVTLGKMDVSGNLFADTILGTGNAAKDAAGKVDTLSTSIAALPVSTTLAVTVEGMAAVSTMDDLTKQIHDMTSQSNVVKLFGDTTEIMTKLDGASKGITDLITDPKTVKLNADINDFTTNFEIVDSDLLAFPGEKTVDVSATVKEPTFVEAKRKVDSYISTEMGITVIAIPDSAKLAETKKTIDDNIPASKRLDVEVKLDEIATKAQTERISKMLEFEAKVDVADINAKAAMMEAAFKSVGTSVTALGTEISAAFSALAGNTFYGPEIMDYMDKVLKQQQQALDDQSKLVDAQVKYLTQRAATMASGQSLITITGDGLQIELEAFMWKILSKIQMKVADEHAAYLLGIAA